MNAVAHNALFLIQFWAHNWISWELLQPHYIKSQTHSVIILVFCVFIKLHHVSSTSLFIIWATIEMCDSSKPVEREQRPVSEFQAGFKVEMQQLMSERGNQISVTKAMSHTWQRHRKTVLLEGMEVWKLRWSECEWATGKLRGVEDWMGKTRVESLKGNKLLSEYKGGIIAGLTKRKQFRLAFSFSSSHMELLFGWHNGPNYHPQEKGVPTPLARES